MIATLDVSYWLQESRFRYYWRYRQIFAEETVFAMFALRQGLGHDILEIYIRYFVPCDDGVLRIFVPSRNVQYNPTLNVES